MATRAKCCSSLDGQPAARGGQDAILTSSFTALVPGRERWASWALAEVAREAMASAALGGLVLTGGDIARSCCQAVQVEALNEPVYTRPSRPALPQPT